MKTYIPNRILINREELENRDLQKKLLNAIQQDAEITDPTNISVNVEKQHGKTGKIELFGEVNNESDKSRAEEIVRKNTDHNIKVINSIKIDPDFNTPPLLPTRNSNR